METNQKESEDVLVIFLHEHIFKPLETQQNQKLERIERGIDAAVTNNEYVQDINRKLDSLIAEHNTIKTDLGETGKDLLGLSKDFKVKMTELNTLGKNQSSLMSEFQTNTSTAFNIIGESLVQFESRAKNQTDAILQSVEQKSLNLIREWNTGKDQIVEVLGTKISETSEHVSSVVTTESEKVSAKVANETGQLSIKSENGFTELSEKLANQKEEHITSLQTQDNLIQTQAESTKHLLEQHYQHLFGFQKKHSQLIVGLLIAQVIQMGMIIFLLLG